MCKPLPGGMRSGFAAQDFVHTMNLQLPIAVHTITIINHSLNGIGLKDFEVLIVGLH